MEVLSRYGIEQADITLLKHNENRTYRVAAAGGEAYVLRVHDPVTRNLQGVQHRKEGLEAELELLDAIAANTALLSPTPVRNTAGERVTEMSAGDRTINCTLLHWIEGRSLRQDDLADERSARELGARIAELHRYLRTVHDIPQQVRPHYGTKRIALMLEQIYGGVQRRLFGEAEYAVVERTLQTIASRAERLEYGVIHADLNLSNILLTPQGDYAMIDFSLSGYGYYAMDAAMGALNVPADRRGDYLSGYLGGADVSEETLTDLEGFMLVSVLGYYAFQMENEKIHPWIAERMPRFCENRCTPYLKGERIFGEF